LEAEKDKGQDCREDNAQDSREDKPQDSRCPVMRLVNDFWGTLGDWEASRPLWLAGGLSAACFEIFSYLYFQRYLGLRPCEYCVLIRLAMVLLALGGLVGAIYPKSLIAKVPGYIIAIGASVWGLVLSVRLEFIVLESATPGYIPPCSSGQTSFPLGIPLDKMLPGHFHASGTCGVDGLWDFWGFTMTELLIMAYVVYITGLCLMLAAGVLRRLGKAPA
jgi:disulfide bond formation protein DsbB